MKFEKEEAQNSEPNARFVVLLLILVEKHTELHKSLRKYKARLVTGGHNLRSAATQRIREMLNHVIPASLSTIRTCLAHELCYADGTTKVGDVVGAYLKARLRGPTVWAELPPEFWPEWWHGAFKRHVVPLRGAVYGLQRAGYEWGWQNPVKMISLGYVWIRDIGEDSVYLKMGVLVILHSDDYACSGPLAAVDFVTAELDGVFRFSPGTRAFEQFIGIEKDELPTLEDGFRRSFVHQRNYTFSIIEKYKVESQQRNLRQTTTPLPVRELDATQSKRLRSLRFIRRTTMILSGMSILRLTQRRSLTSRRRHGKTTVTCDALISWRHMGFMIRPRISTMLLLMIWLRLKESLR